MKKLKHAWVVQWLGLLVATAGEAAPPTFSFLQVSDTHFDMAESAATFRTVSTLGVTDLAPFGISAPKPDFALITGDLTEFGDYEGAWAKFQNAWREAKLPAFLAIGNHDSTWRSLRPRFRALYGAPFYSFDHEGVHFVALESAGIQDPRPAFTEEQLIWLRDDLARLDPKTPVFLYLHHPLFTNELASSYEGWRLLGLGRERNLALVLFGHGHQAESTVFGGVPAVEGGSSFTNPGLSVAGFNIVDLRDGMIRVAYKSRTELGATLKVLETPLPAGPTYPQIRFEQPLELEALDGAELGVSVRINDAFEALHGGILSATARVDDKWTIPLMSQPQAPGVWAASQAWPSDFVPGAHFIHVTFQAEKGVSFDAVTQFSYERRGHPLSLRWRRHLGASSKAAPAVSGDRIYVTTTAGQLVALERSTGATLWQRDFGAEILASPVVAGDRLVVATGDGAVMGLALDGSPVWSFDAGDSVYGTPALSGDGRIYFGTNAGQVFCLRVADGALQWKVQGADYAIESGGSLDGSRGYFTAWDQKVHAFDRLTGAVAWSVVAQGSAQTEAQGAKNYYSPADSTPVISLGRLFVADRAYQLSIIDLSSGRLVGTRPDVSAVSLSEDGRYLYLRRPHGELTRADLDGNPIWSVPLQLDAVPVPARESAGLVYAVSGRGLLSVVRASSGQLIGQYQLTPQLYVFAQPLVVEGVVFSVGYDGSVTALKMDPG